MNAKTILAGTAISLAMAAAAATPANAVITTFATFSPIGLDNFYYNNPETVVGPNPGGSPNPSNGRSTSATFYSISTATSKVPGPVDVKFSFINEGSALDTAVNGVTAMLTLSGTTDGPAVLDAHSHQLEEFVSGTFILRSTTAITVGHQTYGAGKILLQGSFGNANLEGKNSQGSVNGDNDASFGDTLSYSSDFVTFAPTANLDITLGLTSIVPALADAKVGTYALKTFKTDANGQFSADPSPKVNAVPEPASWALMIVGFGLAGASIRRRTQVQTAA